MLKRISLFSSLMIATFTMAFAQTPAANVAAAAAKTTTAPASTADSRGHPVKSYQCLSRRDEAMEGVRGGKKVFLTYQSTEKLADSWNLPECGGHVARWGDTEVTKLFSCFREPKEGSQDGDLATGRHYRALEERMETWRYADCRGDVIITRTGACWPNRHAGQSLSPVRDGDEKPEPCDGKP